MPRRPPARLPTRPPEQLTAPWTSRRAVLRAAGLAALAAPLAGCGALADLRDVRVDPDWPGSPAPPVPDADERARRAAATSARDLAARALGTVPADLPAADAGARALAEVVAACAVHLEQLDGAPTATGTAAPSGPPSAPGAAAGPDAASGTGGDAGALVDALAAAARGAGDDLAGTSPGLARLLASVAASRALLARQLAAAVGAPEPALPPLPAVKGNASTTDGEEPAAQDSQDTEEAGGGDASPAGPADPADAAGAGLVRVAAGALAASRAAEVAAASLDGGRRERALSLRDALAREAAALGPAIAASGAEPPVPEAGYALASPVRGPQDAAALVVLVLDRLAATALGAVAELPGDRRALAADVLLRSAAAAGAWRPSPDPAALALPGTSAP
ncbi:DUF4439 domain-containing protein [Pseudokineococcus sp. 5B2Z-1]|uniref:DUF4439 domain-containing protein n=1 Tax=Pseudokineococcus sp. 5B2Z-1 TaxID=3132744 RepID=UPI0030A98C43